MTVFRKGDRVAIEGVVRSDPFGTTISIDVDGHYSTINLSADNVRMLRPNFEIGEDVIWTPLVGSAEAATIIGTAGEEAWIEYRDSNGVRTRKVALISEVERRPEPVEEPPRPRAETAAEAAG